MILKVYRCGDVDWGEMRNERFMYTFIYPMEKDRSGNYILILKVTIFPAQILYYQV